MKLIAKHMASGSEREFSNSREMMNFIQPVKEYWVVFYRYSNGFETEGVSL